METDIATVLAPGDVVELYADASVPAIGVPPPPGTPLNRPQEPAISTSAASAPRGNLMPVNGLARRLGNASFNS